MSTVHGYKKFFTLIELLVVIAVGILLTALAVPAFRSLTRVKQIDVSAGWIKNALERARVRAVNERCYVAVVFPNGDVSDQLKRYRLGGFRLAYAEKNLAGKYIFSKWLDVKWHGMTSGVSLSQVKSSAFVPVGGDITDCTLKITDALAGADTCLSQISEIKDDDASTSLDAGEYCALIFTPRGSADGSGKCYFLISETQVTGDNIIYPTAATAGPGRSANNVVLKLNKLTGIVEYDK